MLSRMERKQDEMMADIKSLLEFKWKITGSTYTLFKISGTLAFLLGMSITIYKVFIK